METRVQETQDCTTSENPVINKRIQETQDSATPENPEIEPVVKKPKTLFVPKIEPRVVAIADSHWQKLSPEIQEKIEMMAAREVHREKLNKVCEEDFLLVEQCFVCKKEEWGMLSTPCCQRPAHLECCPAPIHVHTDLRRVCMILDLEGFILKGKRVVVREVGWCDMHGFSDSFHFKPEPDIQFNSLSPADKRTVNYVFHNIHALPFEARPRENAINGYLVDFVVKTLCEKLSTLERDVVAYKGGTLEKQLLTRLNIPHVDLEAYGCPKPNHLLFDGFEPLFDCGHHIHSHSHYPRVETYLFYQWLTCHS